jgi:hypothetical protein
MSDPFGLPTCDASPLVKAEDAEFTTPAATDSYAINMAPTLVKKAPLDRSGLARRIYDNLNWAYAFDPHASPCPTLDIWQNIKALWTKSDKKFVTGVYEVLLGRPPEPSALAKMCADLASGASRVALVRAVARSDEAAASLLDLSWLPELHEMESEDVWEKVQSLWDQPAKVFVASLYSLLLDRPPEREGVLAFCRALETGTSRACVVRAFALSDEAQSRGISVSWLPRLENLSAASRPPSLFSLHWLKRAFRRWRSGKKSEPAARRPISEKTPQHTVATAEGGHP